MSEVAGADQLALEVGCRDMRKDLLYPLHRYRMVYLRRYFPSYHHRHSILCLLLCSSWYCWRGYRSSGSGRGTGGMLAGRIDERWRLGGSTGTVADNGS